MDMRYNWLKDRDQREQFEVTWRQGQSNIADHLTKDLPTEQLRRVRGVLVDGGSKLISTSSIHETPHVSDPRCEEKGVYCSKAETSPQDTPLPSYASSSHHRTATTALIAVGCKAQP